ncbi:homeodomain-containing protein [Breznakia blatticola]|uniref:Homeodomain-containing protein n=1 Tax=Breznakia blatticola TaxID=1754012 RepID=A0A4R7Z9Z0_9FIRM|nr:DDE-type integrase/transposase/recombinase [Breznakia blatticola]TDW07922.1 homeodomain-containing protein [Breznakia blatticola]
MDKEKKLEKIAVFRYGIIAPLVSGTIKEHTTNSAFFRDAAQHHYVDPEGVLIKVHEHTIRRWYNRYQKGGFEELKPKRRTVQKTPRKISSEVHWYLEQYLEEHPKLPSTMLYQKLLEQQVVTKRDVSLSTVTRYVKGIRNQSRQAEKEMHRYERAHINEVWCADSSVCIYLQEGTKKRRTYIIAFIDDASRMITGIDVFYEDNFINLMSVMRKAIMCYGKPKVFNFDNGSPYRNGQMELLAARIGTVLHYCKPYTPTSKAKIERFFKTLKQQWMSGIKGSDFKNLQELRKSLQTYVKSYNTNIHRSLDTSPQNRFFQESKLIYRLSEEKIKEAFLLEMKRKVSKDCVIHLNNKEYEVHYRYSNSYIILRYSSDMKEVYVVDDDGTLTPIKLLDKTSNAHIKRNKVKLFGEDAE